MSIIKLTDGKRCYIQAVLDNFSRCVLAWRVTGRYGGVSTKRLITDALAKARSLGLSTTPEIMVDGGIENFNRDVDQLVDDGTIKRTLAQIEIDFSNSLIESLFLRLKHWHLYLKKLNTIDQLRLHTDFYLRESHNRIPRAVLSGATPLEAISGGRGVNSVELIQEKYARARSDRIEHNRSTICSAC